MEIRGALAEDEWMRPTRSACAALLSLTIAAGAGGCAQDAVAHAQAGPTSCPSITYGGYTGDARCAALAARPIRGIDRACTADADCVVLTNSAACEGRAVASAHASRYTALEPSCVPPMAGPCNPVRALCTSGCCATFAAR